MTSGFPRAANRSASPAARLVPWAALVLILFAPLLGARWLDRSFNVLGKHVFAGAGAEVYAVAHLPRPNGGSVAVLRTQAVAGCPAGRWCVRLVWLDPNGGVEFDGNLPPEANFTEVTAAAIDSQGRVVVVGTEQYSGTDHDFRIVRVLPTGALDAAFNGGGI